MCGYRSRAFGKFLSLFLVSTVHGFQHYGRVTANRFITKSFATHRFEFEPFGETYSLRKVTKWLAETRTPKSDYELVTSRVSPSIHNSGMRLKLNEELQLSIHTDPTIAGESFCETGLMKGGRLLHDDSFGYGDAVCRWDEPEDLFQHIVEVRQKLKDKHDE